MVSTNRNRIKQRLTIRSSENMGVSPWALVARGLQALASVSTESHQPKDRIVNTQLPRFCQRLAENIRFHYICHTYAIPV